MFCLDSEHAWYFFLEILQVYSNEYLTPRDIPKSKIPLNFHERKSYYTVFYNYSEVIELTFPLILTMSTR